MLQPAQHFSGTSSTAAQKAFSNVMHPLGVPIGSLHVVGKAVWQVWHGTRSMGRDKPCPLYRVPRQRGAKVL